MRPEAVFEVGLGRPLDRDMGGEPRRIHDVQRRRPDEIDVEVAQHRDVDIERAGIAGEVLMGRELCGIDEDRDHDAVGFAAARRTSATCPA